MKHLNLIIKKILTKLPLRSFQFSVIFIALTALTMTQTNAQGNLKLGAGLGLMSPVSDYGGSTIDYYNGSGYGLSSGLNVQGKIKVGLSGFNLTGEIDYASLNNTGNFEPGHGQIDVTQKILSLKVGPEFRLSIPSSPVVPYLGINLALNSFSGETMFQGVSKVPSGTYNVNSETRFGVGFSAGAEVSVGPMLWLDFNLSYNLMNVAGGEWKDVNPGTNQRLDSYLSLNDEPDPQYSWDDDKHFASEARSIQSILFTVSILFGL